MVNLLVAIVLSGIAVTFVIEFISLGLALFYKKERIYSVFSLPLSFGAFLCFYDITRTFFVAVPAISFIALVINRNINRTLVVSNTRRIPNI
ncbi:hypothetical protein UFOVP964_37 [uncultured Caudovirales phage]|uniref:Uncharacterized protein n=1 Tax=uncultured Caudovirales phage TaxID=2100421 RepID=A0A6J5RJ83_9CAUD|nr:hypothetical protein UFOVP854_37 [uncultured Caudovirales phage]CAB4174276.1 hypothetical protein UFOVP964_37 [uncultured Caudovirales phage]CAB4179481.1 hypothetical protein UFOVP1034_121 [uncultured Caudovirales phage]CAB4189165.1 hypothetical protein UFOVP1177_121 [uncultured Caudovirales phage]CAB4193581.1 hypothetical protein UFOVP1243_108 [uncultured Caudovirales phage]